MVLETTVLPLYDTPKCFLFPKSNNNIKTKKRSERQLEELITKTEKAIKEIKDAQFLPENYMDYKKMMALDQKLKELEDELAILENEYLS